ncbi:MAG: type II secretion system F family protein [Gammaproteobacteria bacterium]
MALELNQSDIKQAVNSEGPVWKKQFTLFQNNTISPKDRIFIFQQMQLLLQTGTPLRAGLAALRKQEDKASIVRLLTSLIDSIDDGKSFSYALAKFPEVFTSTHINLIAASEEGGYMDKVLQQIIDMEERRMTLKETIVSAISYPLFLATFSFAVIVFILVIVFPKFAELFEKIYEHLPVTTRFLMWTSQTLINHWMLVIGALITVFALAYYWLKSDAGKRKIDAMKLSMPVVKNVFTQVYLVQSLRVMYLSLSNGVTIVDTLNSCKNTVQNKIYQEFLTKVELKVQEGSGISNGFSQAQFVPPLVKQMISTGEDTGNLPIVMGKIADHYEGELLKHLKTLSKLAEPIMLVVMGAIVGVIVSSLILPIFMLSRVVN